jgi:hypothetical protein
MTDERDEGDNENSVGYGRPPEATRFAPGKSGNPRGRPKGSRSFGAILMGLIRQKISITENGKTRRVPVLEGMLRRLVNDALRSDAGAQKLLFSLVHRYGDAPDATIKLADILAEDQAILSRYLSQPGTPASSPCPAAAADETTRDVGGDNDDAE